MYWRALKSNPDWANRRAQDDQQQRLAFVNKINGGRMQFQAMLDASNRAFQGQLQANQRFFDTLTQSNQQFNARQVQSTNASIARAQAKQNSLDVDAYKHALYYGDKAEFTNPYNGQTIISSNRFSNQWMSNDGRQVVMNNGN